ncbi:hypothetical protein AB1Y20_009422 [Prymnesium parvum]|uniref:Uncharacterized protein n=1 Tax=Prymnesium parvum TaxID=97485 RepID=A0AB34K4Q1_PRYPA
MERYQLYATSPSSLSSSTASRSSQASSAPRTISSKNNAIRHEPNWASKRGPPSLYIGPWQEFALGRAIAQRPPRRSGALQAPSEEASEEELSQFVTAFKDMAADLDEATLIGYTCHCLQLSTPHPLDGAKKLLKWSPLFMPSIPGLMLPAQPGAPRATGRSRMPAAREAGHRSASSSNTTGCRQASGKARQVPSAVAELRDARVQKLQQLYGCGASSTSCTGGECSSAPAPELLSRSGSMPNTPGKVRTPGSGTKPGSPGNEDEWEDEVDGLLLWTSELQVPPSPG